MKKVYGSGLMVFFILAIVEKAALIVADCTHEAAAYSIARWVKPFLMPSLAIAAMLDRRIPRKTARFIICALIFHAAGDILLLFSGENYFIAGIGAFFIGHILYLVSLWGLLDGIKVGGKIGIIALTAGLAVGLMLPYRISGFLQICAYIYGATLLSLVSFSLTGLIRGHRNAVLSLIGGVLFVISDSLIAVSAFHSLHLPFHDSLIMLTYLAAQFLIVISFRKRLETSTIQVL